MERALLPAVMWMFVTSPNLLRGADGHVGSSPKEMGIDHPDDSSRRDFLSPPALVAQPAKLELPACARLVEGEPRLVLPDEPALLRRLAVTGSTQQNICPDLADCLREGDIDARATQLSATSPDRLSRTYECRTYPLNEEERSTLRELEMAANSSSFLVGVDLETCLPGGLREVERQARARLEAAHLEAAHLEFIELETSPGQGWTMHRLEAKEAAPLTPLPLREASVLPDALCPAVRTTSDGQPYRPSADLLVLHCGRIQDVFPWGVFPENPCTRSVEPALVRVNGTMTVLEQPEAASWLDRQLWPLNSMRDIKRSVARTCSFAVDIPLKEFWLELEPARSLIDAVTRPEAGHCMVTGESLGIPEGSDLDGIFAGWRARSRGLTLERLLSGSHRIGTRVRVRLETAK